eukprot:TRINITY_DN72468_c0_g1_i1.p1 TRINITY_DN72468_c0_g1~~TRINITY_DN72468_c0_g1_i1.p1  ORF type:complete len:145 (+),score=3.06 TRINITY_DN72468_c0_g1_i1:74-508(+)
MVVFPQFAPVLLCAFLVSVDGYRLKTKVEHSSIEDNDKCLCSWVGVQYHGPACKLGDFRKEIGYDNTYCNTECGYACKNLAVPGGVGSKGMWRGCLTQADVDAQNQSVGGKIADTCSFPEVKCISAACGVFGFNFVSRITPWEQ